MIFFGDTIRKAREAKGLTTSQVAERTHILVQIIEAMEREDFKRIPAAIYGRGFVRHIAEVLEIDPKPLVAEFMEIYEGRKPRAIKDNFPGMGTDPKSPMGTDPSTPGTGPQSPLTDVSGTVPTPGTDPKSPMGTGPTTPVNANTDEKVKGLALFEAPMDAMPPKANPFTPASSSQDIFASAYRDEEAERTGPSAAEKFRESLSVVSHGVIGGVRNIPRSAWRMAVLIVGAITVISLLVWGCKVLYRITEVPAPPAATPAAAVAPEAATPTKTATKAAKAPAQAPAKPVKLRSTGQKVPPLYVD